MSEFIFADEYKRAGLEPGPDVIKLREVPFEKLIEIKDNNKKLDLVRKYFGMKLDDGFDWFSDIFREADPSFSIVDNDREAQVLAACALQKLVDSESVFDVLAILCASFSRKREVKIYPELVENARAAQIRIGASNRRSGDNAKVKINFPANSSLGEDFKTAGESNSTQQIAPFIQRTDDKCNKLINAGRSLRDRLEESNEHIKYLHEEISMLWWHIGGFSDVINEPLELLEPGAMAIISGIELADISTTYEGPPAASALLARTVRSNSGKKAKQSIFDIVSAFTWDSWTKFNVSESSVALIDLMPILGGLYLYGDLQAPEVWKRKFNDSVSFVNDSTKLTLEELAIQSYRERQLLCYLDSKDND